MSGIYTDFTLVSVQESRQEKMQLIQTFGEDFVMFFGEQPRMINCGGVLVNSEDFDWRGQFWMNYDRYLRGTKLVERRARAYLHWDGNTVEGYLINAQATDDAMQPYAIRFGFSMLVTDYHSASEDRLWQDQNFGEKQLRQGGIPRHLSEFVGNRSAEVTSNGALVELELPWWMEQIKESLGPLGGSPEEALQALINDPKQFGKDLAGKESPLQKNLRSAQPLRAAIGEYVPGPGPYRTLLNTGVGLGADATTAALDPEEDLAKKLAGGKALRRLIGPGRDSANTLVSMAFK